LPLLVCPSPILFPFNNLRGPWWNQLQCGDVWHWSLSLAYTVYPFGTMIHRSTSYSDFTVFFFIRQIFAAVYWYRSVVILLTFGFCRFSHVSLTDPDCSFTKVNSLCLIFSKHEKNMSEFPKMANFFHLTFNKLQ